MGHVAESTDWMILKVLRLALRLRLHFRFPTRCSAISSFQCARKERKWTNFHQRLTSLPRANNSKRAQHDFFSSRSGLCCANWEQLWDPSWHFLADQPVVQAQLMRYTVSTISNDNDDYDCDYDHELVTYVCLRDLPWLQIGWWFRTYPMRTGFWRPILLSTFCAPVQSFSALLG